MNHPRTQVQQQTPAPPSFAAWSAGQEKKLRRCVKIGWSLGWISVAAAIVFAIARAWWTTPLLVLCAGSSFWLMQEARTRLMDVMANRPRSTARLTNWTQHHWLTATFKCQCGEILNFLSATWFPNCVDRGGGRFSMVCACGRGHFKLKEWEPEAAS